MARQPSSMPVIDDTMFAKVAKNGHTEEQQMEQFRKFLDVYNKKLAAMKDGKTPSTDLDIEEMGTGSPKQTDRNASKKAAHLTAKIQSIKENEHEHTVDPSQVSPYDNMKSKSDGVRRP